MATFAERFRTALKAADITAAELSRKLGIPEGTISQYKAGAYEPKQRRLEAIANALNVSIPWLMGATDDLALAAPANIIAMPTTYTIPLLGSIACGAPILAEENIECGVEVPEHVRADFALRCKGDSMINARIFDGDIVYIRQQPSVDSGQIAAVLVDDEATLKRVRLYPDHISLEPENPLYRPLVLWEEDMNSVRILGKAVAFTSAVR